MEIIYGNTPSKSNCYKIGYKSLYKTKSLTDYENSFFMQLSGKLRDIMIESYFELIVDVYYPSGRADLDNSLKIILDCLQKTRTIKNDNRCVKIVARRFIDKKEPRIEFKINTID
tara:strand:+ start:260 stop:604 length:345 start_codon:yes stop_codon:yes gene_type:complete